MRGWVLFLLFAVALAAVAEERVAICYNFGCVAQAEVVFDDYQWLEATRLIGLARNAEGERALIALAVGRLYGWAGQQSPVRNDRAGNYRDMEVDGRMDCIDHSTSTTRLLKRLESYGALRWHRVLEPARRARFVFAQHFAAVVEDKESGERFAVDSWFVDNGQPAVVLPLAAWKDGEGPDVE